MSATGTDYEVEQAMELLKGNGGRARIGHKTKPAQGKIAKDVVLRMALGNLVDVRGPNVFLRKSAAP